MVRKNLIKIVSSISFLLLLILSCDERTPTSAPPANTAYSLTLQINNESCVEPATFECSDGSFCSSASDNCEIYTCLDESPCSPFEEPCDDGSECTLDTTDTECTQVDNFSEITGDSMCYASNNLMGSIKIIALLTDNDNQGVAVSGQPIEFIAVRTGNSNNLDLGYLTYDVDTNPTDQVEDYVPIDNLENTPVTGSPQWGPGRVDVEWYDNLAVGDFRIIATYNDPLNEANNVSAEKTISLISTVNRIDKVNGYIDPSGTLFITDENPLPTVNVKAMVLGDNSVPLSNIPVNFSIDGEGSGSIQPPSTSTDGEGIATITYTTAPGTDNDTIKFNVSVNGPESCTKCNDEIELIVSSDVFPQEYYVKDFSLDSDLYIDEDGDGKRELVLLDEVDSTYTISFEASATDLSVIGVENVPVFFRNLTSYGTLTVPESYGEGEDFPLNTNSSGQSIADLLIDKTDIPSGAGEILIEAKIMDPEASSNILKIFDADNDPLTDTSCEENLICDKYAIDTVYVEAFTQQYSIVSNITELIINTEGSETVENNNTVNYETTITARTIDSAGGLVIDPVVLKFKKYSGYCTGNDTNNDGSGCQLDGDCEDGICQSVGGFLAGGSEITTDSTGTAETIFEVNSSSFAQQGANKIAFDVYLEQVPTVIKSFDLSYYIEGSENPESDVDEFEFYPNSDIISHALFEETNISVIAKNSAGVGISDVLVRFDLNEVRCIELLDEVSCEQWSDCNWNSDTGECQEVRGSNGQLSSGFEYTCCGDSDEGSGGGSGEDSFACPDGSGCSPEDDSNCPGECSASSSGGGASGGQNGIATVTYTNVQEGMDKLYAYILDPNDQSDTLKVDSLIINSIPNCPDCAEQLILTADKYTLPGSGDTAYESMIYAFYSDSLGNPATTNDVITFEAIQFSEQDNDWIDVGSISPENAFWESINTSLITQHIPEEFENTGSTIVNAQAQFNMDNSSGLVRIVGSYQGLTDTLGLQINSIEPSFVEILAPFPSQIMVQGGGGQESTVLTAEIRDGNGNLITQREGFDYNVLWEVTEPQLDGLHLNGNLGQTQYGTSDNNSFPNLVTNGSSSVTLNSGKRPGTSHIRVTVTDYECDFHRSVFANFGIYATVPDIDGDGTKTEDDLCAWFDEDWEDFTDYDYPGCDCDFEPLVAEATPVTVTTGPPTSGIIGYAFEDAVNFGASFTEMPISIMLWDAWANPVADCTAVYFTLDPPNTAAIIPEAKTGGVQPGSDDAWPGMAWTTTQYSNAQLFEIPEIIATTTGNICINQTANFDSIDECLCTAGTWQEDINECVGGFFTGNKWLAEAADGNGAYGLCAITDLYNPELCDVTDGYNEDYYCTVDLDGDGESDNCTNDLGLPCNCEDPSTSGFGADPNQNDIYWGVALPIRVSSYDNQVDYENVCVDCTLSLLPVSQGGLGNTQHDFACSSLTPYEVELSVQVTDSFGVNVEGALVDLVIVGSQGGPIVVTAGCRDGNDIATNGIVGAGDGDTWDILINEAEDPDIPYDNEQSCINAGGVWGYSTGLTSNGNWVNEYADPSAGFGALQLKTDTNGVKYFKVTFTENECTQTGSGDTITFTCSSPTIEANLFSPNGGVSNPINITINNTCLPDQEPGEAP